MKDLIEEINALPITNKAENTWVNKKLVPVNIKLVELSKVIDIVVKNNSNDNTITIREVITDLENMSNGYEAVDIGKDGRRSAIYIIYKDTLDAYILQLEDRIIE
jgi:hypothetical protein